MPIAVPSGKPGRDLSIVENDAAEGYPPNGIVLRGVAGSPLYATADGIVSSISKSDETATSLVVIEHGAQIQTTYEGEIDLTVSQGLKLRKGDILGRLSPTPSGTGPSVRYAVTVAGQPVNTAAYLGMTNVPGAGGGLFSGWASAGGKTPRGASRAGASGEAVASASPGQRVRTQVKQLPIRIYIGRIWIDGWHDYYPAVKITSMRDGLVINDVIINRNRCRNHLRDARWFPMKLEFGVTREITTDRNCNIIEVVIETNLGSKTYLN